MEKRKLSGRPNLEHLRGQAKALLAGVKAGEGEAVATMVAQLPAAKGMSAARVKGAGFKLADAQSAVARRAGFDSWAQMVRHVEVLRGMEGAWGYKKLEVDGTDMPVAVLGASRILMEGDRFRVEAPGAVYEGVFGIEVGAEPWEIDMEFLEGPEKGKWNYGIFRVEGERLEICLDMNGKKRPGRFGTAAGTGHAYEILERVSGKVMERVTGEVGDRRAFAYVGGETMERLQGEWEGVRAVMDGQEVPKAMVKTGRRVMEGNEVKVSFGGQVKLHVLMRVIEGTEPLGVEWYNLGQGCEGVIQTGIMKWVGEEICFCVGAMGAERPGDFSCAAGSGRTVSQWRRKSG